ncbi:hypothetical protein NDU88_008690 [Pleurodeles waltl]|uniref:Uncharacterized protein n=1 Tax=Pleurodeles waltl TaxID=8319 RepID=A0AAV7QPH2_PLEWA|nr:hypothetical protein NDU88_008690 [Pleurodeles waltl]
MVVNSRSCAYGAWRPRRVEERSCEVCSKCPDAPELLSRRLSINPAEDASEWRLPRGVHGEEESLPGSLDNDDAGTALENPDIRVPSGTKREDGLQRGNEEEKDAEDPGREENSKNTDDKEEKADDDRRNGNSVVPTEAADQGRKEGKERRHAYRPPRPRRDVANEERQNIFASQEGTWEEKK